MNYFECEIDDSGIILDLFCSGHAFVNLIDSDPIYIGEWNTPEVDARIKVYKEWIKNH